MFIISSSCQKCTRTLLLGKCEWHLEGFPNATEASGIFERQVLGSWWGQYQGYLFTVHPGTRGAPGASEEACSGKEPAVRMWGPR